MIRNLVILLFMLVLFPLSVMAINHFEFKPNTLIQANIAAKNITRISFNRNIIQEVVGDQSAYQLISDLNASNIYITPKLSVGSKFTISLVNNRGQAQDIEFTVQNIAPKAIVIESNEPTLQDCSINDEAINMLKTMKLGCKGKYYVLGSNRFIKSNNPDLRILEKQTYRYKDLVGSVLSVKNLSKQDIELKATEFEHLFTGTILTSIDKPQHILGPREEIKIFVVTRIKEGGCQ